MKKLFILLVIIAFYQLELYSQAPSILWSYDLKSVSFGNSCAADIDNDGKLEIVFSTYFNDETIYALNAEDGTLLWKYVTGGCNDAAPIIYDVDGDSNLEVILHSSSIQRLYCFNGSDGKIKWIKNAPGTDSPPSIEDADNDGKPEIIGGDFAGNLVCYNAENGSQLWSTNVDNISTIQSEPVIEDVNRDGELDCVVATWRRDTANKIAAYRIKDGKEIWECNEPQNEIYHGPSIADIDNDNINEVIIGSYDGVLYCLNGNDGTIKWAYSFPEKGYIGAPTTIGDINNDGKYEIAFVSNDHLGILRNDGSLLWDYYLPLWRTAFRGVIFSDVNNDNNLDVVFGDYSGLVTALNGKDGSEIFKYDFQKIYGKTFFIDNAPIIADFNNDGNLELFIIGGYTENPAVENSYGRAYMVSIGKSTGPDWLMFRRNVRRNAVIPIPITSVNDAKNQKIEPDLFSIIYNEKQNLYEIDLSPRLEEFSQINIYDLLGNLLFSQKIEQTDLNATIEIDCSKFTSGTYFVNLVGNNKIISRVIYRY